ncbi:MAG: cupin domain-containing protein [Candidatus Saccharibacteria bacterium]|nr:cupin domain-containing protein [Rhodoferax sp.]
MNVHEPLALLGGLSPATFMQRHWHKKPLVIRQALPGFVPPLDRADLIALAARPEVESRLIVQGDTKNDKGEKGEKGTRNAKSQPTWKFRHGPFARAALPPFKQPGWTVLLQGMDLHDERIHALMSQFRFIPDARLDDLMVSYATDCGGVGPHYDSYDVFLLQTYGQRRWRIGRQKDLSLVPNMPLKILANFEPEEEFVLNPGDMLYLPPRYAHDGVAVGECMTYSIGFRSPKRGELASELLQRLAEDATDTVGEAIYRDPKQEAVEHSGAIPDALVEFAQAALDDALQDPLALRRALGEYLSEPKAHVSFDGESDAGWGGAIRLDRRTRLMYDAKHVFINGESYVATGRDAQLIRALADQRHLPAKDIARLSEGAVALLQDWQEAGWLHADDGC